MHLERTAVEERHYDLVLLDPPYGFDQWDELLAAVPVGARVVIESDREVVVPDSWEVHRRKRYGGTVVTLATASARRDTVTRVLYPGSFDPVHNGHIEIIATASELFDEVVVAAMRNPQKGGGSFSLDEREEMVREATAHLPNVTITMFSSLVVDLAKEIDADFIIKGLRAVSDFENELQMAQMNNAVSGRAHPFHPVGLEVIGPCLEVHPGDRQVRRRRVVDGPRGSQPSNHGAVRVSDAGPIDGGDLPPEYRSPQAEALLHKVVELIENAKPVPLSASSMINKDEVLPVLQAAEQGLPEELRAARWLLKERDDFLARVQNEGDQIIATARAQAEKMVQRAELVKASEEKARKIVADAEERARHLKLETEDWCDQKLGAMEVVLQRTMKTVASGRSRLQGAERREPAVETDVEAASELPEGFFDQDEG